MDFFADFTDFEGDHSARFEDAMEGAERAEHGFYPVFWFSELPEVYRVRVDTIELAA